MPAKLTLRLDEALIARAKIYAHTQDRSLSKLVADYFGHLTVAPAQAGRAKSRPAKNSRPASGPVTSGLRGVFVRHASGTPAKAPDAQKQYRQYLQDKYL